MKLCTLNKHTYCFKSIKFQTNWMHNLGSLVLQRYNEFCCHTYIHLCKQAPTPHLPFDNMPMSLISADAVQVASWSWFHSLIEAPNPSPSMPLIVRDGWNCLLWPSTRCQNKLPLGNCCYLGGCLLTLSSTFHGGSLPKQVKSKLQKQLPKQPPKTTKCTLHTTFATNAHTQAW